MECATPIPVAIVNRVAVSEEAGTRLTSPWYPLTASANQQSDPALSPQRITPAS